MHVRRLSWKREESSSLPGSWGHLLSIFDTDGSRSRFVCRSFEFCLRVVGVWFGYAESENTYAVSKERRLRFWPLTLKAPTMCSQSLSRKAITEKASEYQEN